MVDGKCLINNKEIKMFDGSSLLKSIIPKIKNKVDKNTFKIIINILSGLEISFDQIILLRTTSKSEILNWLPVMAKRQSINYDLVRLTYTKIFNQHNNIIMIGPVDRSGSRMQNSINYLLEGKIWLMFNMFAHLYPLTFKTNGVLNFIMNKNTSGYVHLIKTLRSILFGDDLPFPKNYTPLSKNNIKIKTKLWDHQIESVNKICTGFKNGYHGFGDASDVGAGKTLTSIAISAELIKNNLSSYSGILILLPGNKLINTWKTEIDKHTEGFDVKYQKNTSNIGTIKSTTMVITTMGRIRDHPINHKWLLVVIDECLTVQNKNALQTEEAWKQSLMSKYIIMMSATFFRTRFDKLYYMLKMLQTGLPEQRDYLETILLESIVSQVSKIKRAWISNINYFILDDETRLDYNQIQQSDLSIELKYAKLSSILIKSKKTNDVVCSQLKKLITKLEKENKRCLIYARSKAEAELWSSKLNISIYPEKKLHTIVTYNDGTYGLNDLIIYDTIIMRPPVPDKLPQIKGRLDRPGQLLEQLNIEYFVLKDTIDEGLILRMNIASQFIQKYIMPLAKFYDLAINHEKYQTNGR